MVRLDHALCCRKGGLIIQHHNEIRNAIGDLAALLWDQVPSEPVVKDASEDSDALIADLGVKGVWQSQLMALFDVRVVEILMPCLLQLKLKRNRSIVLLLLIVVLSSH